MLVAISIAVGIVLFIVWAMLPSRESSLEYTVDHRYPANDPQFIREMSVLLGPAVLPGNSVTALNNGDEIFPSMLAES